MQNAKRIQPKLHFDDRELLRQEKNFIAYYADGSKKSVRLLFKLYKGHYVKLLFSAVFFAIKSSPSWVLPLITSAVINIAASHPQNGLQQLVLYMLGLLLLLALNVPTHYVHTLLFSRARRSVEAGLRGAMVRKLQQLSISFHKEMQSGRIQSKIMRDVEAVEALSFQLFETVLGIILNLSASLVVVLLTNWIVFLFFILCAPIAAITTVAFRTKIRNRNRYGAAPAAAGDYKFTFKNGVINSAATGYESIDNFTDTSVYMLVPGNSDVVFENMTFNGVVSFDVQIYTSPWSYLNSITFKNCTFNGIVIGACPANKAVFTGCTFNNYTNSASANNSNPIWWRAANGSWSGDPDSMPHSLQEFTFVNNKVTSTRPVKIERIGWSCTAKITILDNKFDIQPQVGDEVTKNMAINIGQRDNTSKFILTDDGNTISANTAALYTAALTGGSNQYIAVSGTKILNRAGKNKTITAMVWKTQTNETFTMKTID